MTIQPEPLRLADELVYPMALPDSYQVRAAAELRRLYAENEHAWVQNRHMEERIEQLQLANQELLVALKDIATTCSTAVGAGQYLTLSAIEKAARAAIAKAGGRA